MLVGDITYYIQNEWLFIESGFILPEYRGRGLYRALIGVLEDCARHNKAGGLFLSTYTFEAPGLYEKLGFTKGSVLPNIPRGNTSIDYYKILEREDG